jgi:hypothetical protein
MLPRERIQTALNHEQPDRCPMQISFTPEFADRLKADIQMAAISCTIPMAAETPTNWSDSWALICSRLRSAGLTRIIKKQTNIPMNGASAGDPSLTTPLTDRDVTPKSITIPWRMTMPSRATSRLIPCARNSMLMLPSCSIATKSEYWITGVTVTTIFETAWGLAGL